MVHYTYENETYSAGCNINNSHMCQLGTFLAIFRVNFPLQISILPK